MSVAHALDAVGRHAATACAKTSTQLRVVLVGEIASLGLLDRHADFSPLRMARRQALVIRPKISSSSSREVDLERQRSWCLKPALDVLERRAGGP